MDQKKQKKKTKKEFYDLQKYMNENYKTIASQFAYHYYNLIETKNAKTIGYPFRSNLLRHLAFRCVNLRQPISGVCNKIPTS